MPVPASFQLRSGPSENATFMDVPFAAVERHHAGQRACALVACMSDSDGRIPGSRHFECKTDECQVFFAGLHKIFLI